MPKGIGNSSRSIKFHWDTAEYEANLKKLQDQLPGKLNDILVKTSPEFVKAAVKYTPPNIGKNSIEKRFYERPVLNLLKLIRGEYHDYKPSREDGLQFRNGMRFKVINTKHGVKKGTAFAYCKTISAAKKSQKIATRGLARVMWRQRLVFNRCYTTPGNSTIIKEITYFGGKELQQNRY